MTELSRKRPASTTLACSWLSGLCIAADIKEKILCYAILSTIEMADAWGI